MAVHPVDDPGFAAHLAEAPKVIAKFYAGWCGSCRLIAPKYNRLANDEAYGDVLFLDVDAEASPEARKLAGVTNLPFFATFKNGQLVEADFTAKEEGVKAMLDRLN